MTDNDYECAADLVGREAEFIGIGYDIRFKCRVLCAHGSVRGDCFRGAVDVQLLSSSRHISIADVHPEVLRLDLSRYVAETVWS